MAVAAGRRWRQAGSGGPGSGGRTAILLKHIALLSIKNRTRLADQQRVSSRLLAPVYQVMQTFRAFTNASDVRSTAEYLLRIDGLRRNVGPKCSRPPVVGAQSCPCSTPICNTIYNLPAAAKATLLLKRERFYLWGFLSTRWPQVLRAICNERLVLLADVLCCRRLRPLASL